MSHDRFPLKLSPNEKMLLKYIVTALDESCRDTDNLDTDYVDLTLRLNLAERMDLAAIVYKISQSPNPNFEQDRKSAFGKK